LLPRPKVRSTRLESAKSSNVETLEIDLSTSNQTVPRLDEKTLGT
jgi:hypothetical protein